MKITIRKPDDWHLHLRQGDVLKNCVKHTETYFSRAIVMPNTKPPIVNKETLIKYKKEILDSSSNFEPLMTFKIMPGMTKDIIKELKDSGAVAGKYYPMGVTTNAEDGISSIDQLIPILEILEDLDMVLSFHGEDPESQILDREKNFIPLVEKIIAKFPKLRIVFEHLSTRDAVLAVLDFPKNVAATITAHHLLLTLDDLMGGNLNPYYFCKPVVKTDDDKDALLEAVFSGSPKFFFGSDSAPHLKSAKDSGSPLPGIYSAPVAMPLMVELFDKYNHLGLLEDFTSRFGAEFYELPLNTEKITFIKEEWKVLEEYNGIVPLMYGKSVSWKIEE